MPLPPSLANVRALTFDFFGTVLDLQSSLAPAIAGYLQRREREIPADQFWNHWRSRQRIEQYQDNIVGLGHAGYLATVRKALIYTLALLKIETGPDELDELMAAWQQLNPFADVLPALPRLAERFQLVGLSNGDPGFLDHLATERIGWEFDRVISVQIVGAFKPHPGVYRRAAGLLELEPAACLMVSSNSFDVMGARMCGFRGVFVNREDLPYEDTPYQPDLTVADFTELADVLLDEDR